MKKKKEEGHENTERWLLTYADMITLLMLFFIVLYSMSKVDTAKYQQLSGELQSVFTGGNFGIFNNMLQGQGGIHTGGRGIMDNSGQLPSEKGKSTLRKMIHLNTIKSGLKQDVEAKKLNIISNERGIVIVLHSDVMFDPGSSVILPENKPVLTRIAHVLKEIPNNIRVEGHTDNQPVTEVNTVYNNNWELSGARATKVLELLIDHGLDPEKLSVAAYGSTRPRVPNKTPEDRALNRRVEITIVDSKLE